MPDKSSKVIMVAHFHAVGSITTQVLCPNSGSVHHSLCFSLHWAFSEAKASVPRASGKLGEWLSEIDWLSTRSPWASSAMEAAKETKFDTKVGLPWGWGWCSNFEYTRSAEKARDMTLDNEKYNVRNTRERRIDRTCVVMMALCNQPAARSFRFGPRWRLVTLRVSSYGHTFSHLR